MPTRRMFQTALFSTGFTITLGISSACAQALCPRAVEIDWDNYGVPHIFAPNHEGLFYAFGWSQMHSHANLILSLYGSARGRASEYWGGQHLDADALIHALEIPEAAAEAYARQDPEFKRYIDLFVDGMNDYAETYPEAMDEANRAVLPVQPTDLFAHLLRTMELGFVGRRILLSGAMDVPVSSNALALSPAQTASGHAMLLTNPHLPWSGYYTFYETHFAVGARDYYGVSIVGFPVLVLAFNNTLGWTHTANYVDGADLYEVELIDGDHYLFDGEVKPLEKKSRVIQVKDEAGERQTIELTLHHTIHGPIVLRRGQTAYAYRSTLRLYPFLFEQYWNMINATTLDEFVQALEMMQIPFFNVLYADQDGHIMYMWNGLLPERSVGDAAYWQKTIPGNRSETLWTETFDFDWMPRATDPPTGWLQNTNDLPWTSTLPPVLDPQNFPRLIPLTEELGLRTQQLLKMLQSGVRPSFESLRQIKFQNRVEMAGRILDDLLDAIRASPHTGEDRRLLEEARRVLESWDRRVDAESRGAVLFRAWVRRLGNDIFAQDYDVEATLATPSGLRNPPQAVDKLLESARDVLSRYGALDVKWGDVYRLKRDTVDLPASGGPGFMGIFHSIQFSRGDDGKFYSRGGESYSAIVEFSDPIRAEVLLSYGNSSQEDSEHNGDQLALVAAKTMRKALLSAADIDKELARQELLSIGNGGCHEQ